MIYTLTAIIVLLFIIGIIIFFNCINLKEKNESLIVCQESIYDLFLEKKKHLEKLTLIINNKNSDKEITIEKEMTIFECEELLFNKDKEINKLLEELIQSKTKKKKPDPKEINEIHKLLDLLEESIEGLKDYYNNHANNYNKYFHKKIFHFFYETFGFKEKNVFKLREIEKFEILKK